VVVTAALNLTPDQVEVLPDPAISCDGDSGAPLFDYAANGFPVVRATMSHADAAPCAELQYAVAIRTDAVFAFIAQHVEDGCFESAGGGAGCDGLLRVDFEGGLDP
jgi:hypothetical protein